MKKRSIIISLVIVVVACAASISVPQFKGAYLDYRMGRTFAEWDAFGERIRKADKVEILLLEPISGTSASADITGYTKYRASSKAFATEEQAKSLSRWNLLIYSPRHSGLCHTPPYGMRWWKNSQLVGEATFCWYCGNIFLSSEGVHGLFGFDAARGLWLFDELKAILPLPVRKPSSEK